jgi:RNase adaptor protein for sRNA GlmZ degradation
MGAYGYRGLYERKTHFLQSVPYALKNVRWLLEHVELPIKLPELMKAFRAMSSSERLRPAAEPERLTVRVSSFSFHRGVPQDNTGNGGGFVFDARGLPNPGREERFKSLTGRDAAVIEYLEQYPAVHEYLKHAEALVNASVSNYGQRGFKNLMVSFGCTGGQHRSVYLAESLAKHLRAQNGVDVVLTHRELEKLA